MLADPEDAVASLKHMFYRVICGQRNVDIDIFPHIQQDVSILVVDMVRVCYMLSQDRASASSVRAHRWLRGGGACHT